MPPTLPLPPGVNISVGGSRKKTARVLKAQFGNSYAQRAADGLNAVSSEYSVTFGNLTYAEAKAIDRFFEAQAGYQAFLYRAPGTEEAPKLWTVESWTMQHVDGDIHSITATMLQQFTP